MSYTKQQILDRMKGYLPEFYENIQDMAEILDTEAEEIKDLWNTTESVLNEAFTAVATSLGISRWETILDIVPLVSQTLEQRRLVVQTKLFVKNKACFEYLKTVAKTYVDDAEVTFDNATSTVILNMITQDTGIELYKKIREIVPAHLLLEFTFSVAAEEIGLTEHIYAADLDRPARVGTTWHIGVTPFGLKGTEVQIK